MSNDMQDLQALEEEFNDEVKGFGSLSIRIVSGSVLEAEKLGYNIRPEDIEALYFEGIGTPRWESIEAKDYKQQLAIYNESMDRNMADYPLIGRVKDTDEKVEYAPHEVSSLRDECKKVIENTTNEKAIKAAQRFIIACNKASETGSSIHLNPS